jgi:branched-chain amino acid transport system ATP-binding protein
MRGELATRVASACNLFPPLQGKLKATARTLSGGEKQMLSIAGAFVSRPRLVLLDEPTLGLAPTLASRLLATVYRECRESGTAAILVEHRIADALKTSDRVYLLREGAIRYHADSRTSDPEYIVHESAFSDDHSSHAGHEQKALGGEKR